MKRVFVANILKNYLEKTTCEVKKKIRTCPIIKKPLQNIKPTNALQLTVMTQPP